MLTKMVDGVEVEMEAEEEAAIRAEWAANEVAQAANAPKVAIARIESENPITHRALRELILALGELYPSAKATPFYTRARQTDDAIKAERSKL